MQDNLKAVNWEMTHNMQNKDSVLEKAKNIRNHTNVFHRTSSFFCHVFSLTDIF